MSKYEQWGYKTLHETYPKDDHNDEQHGNATSDDIEDDPKLQNKPVLPAGRG